MPSIVFLCVANSARSQMAEGLARATAPDGWEIYSAGSRPGTVNPMAHEAMTEVGIDIGRHHSKGLESVPVTTADWVVTLCAKEECPVAVTAGERLNWHLPDPAAVPRERARETFRAIRDDLRERIDNFWATTAAPP